MAYPKRLLRLRPGRGINRDLPPHNAPPDFYTAGSNVIFRNGYPERVPPSRDAYTDAVATINPGSFQHAVATSLASGDYWMVFEADGTAWSILGGIAVQIDAGLLGAVATPADHTSAVLNSVPIYSNALDEPVYWDGTVLQTLPDWTATESCRFISVFKYHIFALNISGPSGAFPSLVKWSDAAEPGTVPGEWAPSSSNQAGSVELSDSPGGLVCAYPLRDGLAIYKPGAMYLAQWIGGNEVFSFRKMRNTVGALGPHSVCDVDGMHLLVTEGDIVMTDGTNARSIGQSRMREYLFAQIDQDNYRNLFCVYDRSNGEVTIAYPANGSEFCNKALVYDVRRDSFGQRDLDNVRYAAVGVVDDVSTGNTWSSRNDPSDVWAAAGSELWGSSISRNATNSVLHIRDAELRLQNAGDPESLASSVERGGIDFGEPERLKYVKRLHIYKGSDAGTLLVRVGARMTPNGSDTLTPEVSLGEGEQIVNVSALGRYISVQIRAIDGDVWSVTGIDIEAELRGYH